jgi:hypothetical protein
MTKPESEWTWKELPVGNVVLEPGNASQYRTGDWKTLKGRSVSTVACVTSSVRTWRII